MKEHLEPPRPPRHVSLIQPKCTRLHPRKDAPLSAPAAVSPHTILFPLYASASTSLSPSCPTTRTFRMPVEARGPTERTAIRYGNVRFVFSRDTHPGVEPRTDGNLGRANGDGAISCPRRRHPNVSGNTIFFVSRRRAGRVTRVSLNLPAGFASHGSLCEAENGVIVCLAFVP